MQLLKVDAIIFIFLICFVVLKVVVLARIIPDEEQAISSAAGVKLLVDLLHDSKSDSILALAADCIARLAHTRAGRSKERKTYKAPFNSE